MASYSNNTFVGQKLQIDGHIFRNNVFQNCVLVYGGGPLNMVGNSLHGVRWEFIDAAARTLGLISSMYQVGGKSKEFVEVLLSTFGKEVEPPRPQEAADGESNE